MKFSHFLRPFFAAGLAAQLLVSASAAPLRQSTSAEPAKKTPVQGMFWKATNGSNTVYLLGSIHVASKKMYPLPPVMEDAFKESKTLVVEVNLNDVDQTKMAAMMQEKGMYPEGDSLMKHLTADDKKKLEVFCNKYNFPIIGLERLKPWVASLMLSVLPFLSAGMSPDLGIDQHFLDLAAKTKKKVDQAESMDFQMNLLSSVTDKEAMANLHSALNQMPVDATKFAGNMEDAWIQGDVTRMEKLLSTDRDPKGNDRKLLEDRNPHMADVAEKYLKGTTPCFFVVGTAHLIGTEGVVAILKKRGYTVSQILSPAH